MDEKIIYIVEMYKLTGNCIGVFDSLSSAQKAIYNFEANYRSKLDPETETFDDCYHYVFLKDEDCTTTEYYITKHKMNEIWDV